MSELLPTAESDAGGMTTGPMPGSLLSCGCHIRRPDYATVLCAAHEAEVSASVEGCPSNTICRGTCYEHSPLRPEYRVAPACTCSAGDGMEFPAQHATLCPRFAHPRVLPPGV